LDYPQRKTTGKKTAIPICIRICDANDNDDTFELVSFSSFGILCWVSNLFIDIISSPQSSISACFDLTSSSGLADTGREYFGC
jgi:hypothetical protein